MQLRLSPTQASLLLLGSLLAAAAGSARAGGPAAAPAPAGTEEPRPAPAVSSTSKALRDRLLGLGTSEPTTDLSLHRVRDLVLRHSPGGRRLTEQFYRHVVDMAAASATQPQLRDHGREWYSAWRDPVHELVEGRGADTTVTPAQVQTLLDYVAAMRAAGSPALRQAIDREMPRLDVPSWVGISMEEWLERVNRLSCAPSDTALCLNGGRFRVEAEWRTPQGRTGRARGVPLTADTGYFWFFGEANVEAVVKVLDACTGANPRFWVFAAGLTNVEVDLTVADTIAGTTRAYHNVLRTPFQPIQDTAAFATCAAGGAGAAEWRAAVAAQRDAERAERLHPTPLGIGRPGVRMPQAAWSPATPPTMAPPALLPPAEARHGIDLLAWTPRALASALAERPRTAPSHLGACMPGPETLCLQDGRFRVETEWRTPQGGEGRGRAVQLTPDTGTFWFFRDGNVEEVVKVLDACSLDQRFWVFAAGLTNVRVVTTVTDTLRDETRTYINDQGQAFRPLQDTNAFQTCQ